MAKKNNIGLGLAALAVGAGAVAAVTKGHKAEVKKEERKAAVKAAKKDYRNTELGRYDKNSKGIYYSNGNYEAFARPKKPAGVDEKNAYIVGSGLASLAAACFLVRDGQMPGSHIHILEAWISQAVPVTVFLILPEATSCVADVRWRTILNVCGIYSAAFPLWKYPEPAYWMSITG